MKREQIIETLKNPHWFFFGKLFESDFEQIADAILALPLDVPSDEEVVKSCTQVLTPRIASFLQGARWMRKEIIQRNTHEIDHK